jgi:[histone H3]-lysine36 N-dimethyltransferase SETMAR
MQWIKKGSPGPIKAKVQASRTKQMVLAFFDQLGMIFTNSVPLGCQCCQHCQDPSHLCKAAEAEKGDDSGGTVVSALGQCSSAHRRRCASWWLIKHNIQVLPHPPYSPDLAPADFFLFPKVKEHLADITLTQDTIRSTWERAISTITAEELAAAYRRWLQRNKKYVHIGGDYVEKS